MADEGGGSLFAWPVLALARKIKGKEKVNRALYEHYHRPLKNIDEKAGKFLARQLEAPNLFRQVDVLPTGRKMGGNRALIEHETHSATAPIAKASKVVAPIAASLYLSNLLGGKEAGEKMASSNETETPLEDKNTLLKEAAAALDHAQRLVDAEKLAFALVERGKIPPFQSYEDFHTKVASLMTEDLRVVEKAIEMDASMADFGKVAEDSASNVKDPTAAFYHRLAD
jgi:hypothetical protein